MPDRDRTRRTSFDAIPELYARGRPPCHEIAFDLVLEYAGIGAGARALEIGCGPGQATLPMLRRGLRVVAVEIGPNMARYAAERMAGQPVEVVCSSFEDWPLPSEPFDLVYSASAFQWVAPEVRWVKTATALKPRGTLALMWNRHVRSDDDGFADAVQEVYERCAPHLKRDWRGLPDRTMLDMAWRDEMAASGYYEDVDVRIVPFTLDFTADSYVDLLRTYSDHITLPPDELQRLLDGVRTLITERFGGRIRRDWCTVVFLGRRKADLNLTV